MMTDSMTVVVTTVGIAAVIAIVLIILAWRYGVMTGEEHAKTRHADERKAIPQSIYGKGVSADEASRNLLQTLRSGTVIVDGLGDVRYSSPRLDNLGVVRDGHLVSDEIRDILAQVASDGEIRDREIEMTVQSPSGRITEQSDVYLQVRIGHIATIDTLPVTFGSEIANAGGADELYVIFLEDISEKRHFEQMRRDFVTNVSHELKTPAGAISLLAETVSSAADDPDAVRYFSGRISKESARLTELVQKLIALQKVQDEDGLTATDSEPVSIPRIVREAVAENEVQAAAKHIEIRMYFGDDTEGVTAETAEDGQPDTSLDDEIIVNGDADSLKTAVKNLVENAIHYSPENTHVGVSVRKNGRVQIRVVDQGIGIPADAQKRIFERFYRVDPARSRATGGTGLGLAITKHIVQDAGGTISVWSRPGEGSTFTIDLPKAEK
ncbi:sensor histidine kinase [Bifidobacterium callimiconis]|uniref:sensor histidine kinase n=1 Tax=Bifidobacterium callimiconis TaxID=2306973 RepID=UPI001F0AA5E7|nr:ATP-binding protein [Bifidobacterium callimiconis]